MTTLVHNSMIVLIFAHDVYLYMPKEECFSSFILHLV